LVSDIMPFPGDVQYADGSGKLFFLVRKHANCHPHAPAAARNYPLAPGTIKKEEEHLGLFIAKRI